MDTTFKSLQLIDTDLDIINAKMTLIYLAKDWEDERYIVKVKDIDMNTLELRCDRATEYASPYSGFIKNHYTEIKLELGVTEGYEIIKI